MQSQPLGQVSRQLTMFTVPPNLPNQICSGQGQRSPGLALPDADLSLSLQEALSQPAGQQMGIPTSLGIHTRLSGQPLSPPKSALCVGCNKITSSELTHLCTTCHHNWCIDCLVQHLQMHCASPTSPYPTPCLGKLWGCTATLPPEYLTSFSPKPCEHLSPSSSLCSTESNFSDFSLAQRQQVRPVAYAWSALHSLHNSSLHAGDGSPGFCALSCLRMLAPCKNLWLLVTGLQT